MAGFRIVCISRANEKGMYVKGVVSTLPPAEAARNENVLAIDLVSK